MTGCNQGLQADVHLNNAVLIGVVEEGDAVARSGRLLARGHCHPVEVALQAVVTPEGRSQAEC